MVIGEKVRVLREQKNMSQGDIEKRTGLLRCYISRVENGQTVPSIETLEKWARALEVPMFRLFTDGDQVKTPNITKEAIQSRRANAKQNHEFQTFAKYLSRMDDKNRGLLIQIASKMASRA